jgi:hypothetical protein
VGVFRQFADRRRGSKARARNHPKELFESGNRIFLEKRLSAAIQSGRARAVWAEAVGRTTGAKLLRTGDRPQQQATFVTGFNLNGRLQLPIA